MRRTILTLIAVGVFSLYVISNQVTAARAAAGLVPSTTLETPLDKLIPFFPFAELIYLSVYLFLFLPVVHIKHPVVFERTAYAFYTYNLACIAFFWVFPVRMIRQEFAIYDLWSWGVAFNYAYDPPYNNFPSLHVSNAVFAGLVARRLDRPVGLVALAVAAGISVSTLLVKQHWIVDVVAGIAVASAAYYAIVAPAVPKDAPPEELAFPRRLPMVLVWIYGAIVVAIVALYHMGWKPFEWPDVRGK